MTWEGRLVSALVLWSSISFWCFVALSGLLLFGSPFVLLWWLFCLGGYFQCGCFYFLFGGWGCFCLFVAGCGSVLLAVSAWVFLGGASSWCRFYWFVAWLTAFSFALSLGLLCYAPRVLSVS